jgi:Peptidase family M23
MTVISFRDGSVSGFRVFCVALCLSVSGRAERTATVMLADGFDIPVGKPDGNGYYVFRGYTPHGHLGEDWNGKGGGDSDLGDPVYATAHGIVVFSADVRLGWGNCVIIRHAYRDISGAICEVDSLYGHLDRRDVRKDQIIRRGQQIGTIGTAHGIYAAHLHFELRKNLQVGMNRSQFPKDSSVYYSPRQFITTRRQLAGGRHCTIAIDTFGPYKPAGKPPEREIPTRDSIAGRSDDLKKKIDQLNKIIEQNKKSVQSLSDEDVNSFWDRLKTRLKNGKATSSEEGKQP